VQGDWLMVAAGYAPVLLERAGQLGSAAPPGRGGDHRRGVIQLRAG